MCVEISKLDMNGRGVFEFNIIPNLHYYSLYECYSICIQLFNTLGLANQTTLIIILPYMYMYLSVQALVHV